MREKGVKKFRPKDRYPKNAHRNRFRETAIATERRIIDYHRRHPSTEGPDGSFVMSAFIEGFRLGNREAQRESVAKAIGGNKCE